MLFCRNRKASSSFNSKTSHFRSIIPTKDSRETKAFSFQLTLQMCSCIRGKLMEVRVWLFSGVFLWMIVTVPVSIHSELTNECRVGDFSFSSQFYNSFFVYFYPTQWKTIKFFRVFRPKANQRMAIIRRIAFLARIWQIKRATQILHVASMDSRFDLDFD